MSAQQDDGGLLDSPVMMEELVRILGNVRRALELDLRVAMPATVTAYDPATQTATVSLGYLQVEYIAGEEVPRPPMTLPGIPVKFPGSGPTGYMTFAISPGDTGNVLVSDRCLSTWTKVGGTIDPRNGRAHDIADCWYEPGLRPTAGTIVPPTDLTGTVLEGTLVKLGRLAVSPALKGTEVHTAFTTWTTAVAASGTPGDPASNAAAIAAIKVATATLAGTLGTWLSAKVQVE